MIVYDKRGYLFIVKYAVECMELPIMTYDL
jgi:hypothetical protein